MIIHREIGSSYHHKPIAQGVDYSPLIMEIDEEVLVKERCRPMVKMEAPCPAARYGGEGAALAWWRPEGAAAAALEGGCPLPLLLPW